MAFENRSKGKFITISGEKGKFCESVEANTPDAVTRTNKVGRVVHELFHDSFVGKLVGIRTKESAEYGKSWIFDFQDIDTSEMYHLQLSYSNSFATAFLKMLPNIDLTQLIKLSPSAKLVDGKNQTALFVNQNGAPVKHAYTRENPNGLPDMVKITVKGKETWDDSDRLAYLENMVNTVIIPKLDNAKPITTTQPVAESNDFSNYSDPVALDDDPGF